VRLVAAAAFIGACVHIIRPSCPAMPPVQDTTLRGQLQMA